MNEEKYIQEEDEGLDLMEYVRKLWPARKILLRASIIGAVIGVVVALGTPHKYSVQVTLSPEQTKTMGSGLSSVASMLGLGSMNLNNELDALNALLYPEIVSSTPFIVDLFEARVKTIDEDAEETSFEEFLENQSPSLIGAVLSLPGKAISGIVSLFKDEDEEGENVVNPFHLTKKQSLKVEALRKAINADVDKKTGVTTISVTLGDPMVTAIIADSVLSKLKKSITEYRTSKAQQDCDNLERLYIQRQEEYYTAQQIYAKYVDANKAVVLQSVLTERDRLQNDMALAYQVYSQVATQLQVARAKVQEAKPVFAVVEPATVPLQPSGTSRKVVVLGFIFLAFAGTCAWLLSGKEYWAKLKEALASAS